MVSFNRYSKIFVFQSARQIDHEIFWILDRISDPEQYTLIDLVRKLFPLETYTFTLMKSFHFVKVIFLNLLAIGLSILLLNSVGAETKTFKYPPHSALSYSERFTENALAPIRKPGKVYYVSDSKGDNSYSGTKNKPFKTLKAARDAIRALKKSTGLPKGGVEVLIGKGNYTFPETLTFSQQDSGTEVSPIVWRGIEKNQVVLSGGTQLDARRFLPVMEKSILKDLHPSARGVLLGLSVTSPEVRNALGQSGKYSHLSMNGHILPLAQWPNRGYHHIGNIFDEGPTTRWMKPGEKPPKYSFIKPSGGKFSFLENLPSGIIREFARTRDMTLEGYFHNDWYFQKEAVGAIEGDVLQLLKHTRYGVVDHIKSMDRRVRITNVLCELDEPGEWYFDRQRQKLFVWPINGFDPATTIVTVPGGPILLQAEETSYLTFRDITFENTGNLAVSIQGGNHNLIANSVIRNGAGRGVRITDGKYNGITGCDFYGLGGAFSISGGDERTLQRCYHFATNNRVYDCRSRGYGMIGLEGVGIYFAHNLLHDMNGAVSYRTVDLLMEYNEFYNIGYEMGDFNVAYCGAKWHTMNNVVRYNFVHHLIEPGGHPIAAFRNDDGGAGLKIYGNVLYRTGRAAAQFHGPANELQNNIALNMPIFWWTLRKPVLESDIQEAWSRLSRFGRDYPRGNKEDYLYNLSQKIGNEAWMKSPWIDEFPEVGKFISENPWAQTLCNVSNNYTYDVAKPIYIHVGSGSVKGMESRKKGVLEDLPKNGIFEKPETIQLDVFVDPDVLDFRFKKSFQPMKNFKPIPFENIGLYSSDYRSDVPVKSIYRSAIRKKYESYQKGKYDPEIVNARYPIPEYLN